jgi:predicted Zn-dependent protease
MSAAVAALLLAALTPEPTDAAVLEFPDEAYQACIVGVRKKPAEAQRRAARWLNEGGGAAAMHCQAVADLAAGYPRLAAVRLLAIAERSDAGDMLTRARILGQAALAFLEAEAPEQAESAISAAYALAPEGGELHLIAAKVYVARGKNQAAVDAVNAAEKQGLASASGFVARARAYLALQQPRSAADDVVNALGLDPLNVDALTLRGDLAALGVEIEAQVVEPGSRKK